MADQTELINNLSSEWRKIKASIRDRTKSEHLVETINKIMESLEGKRPAEDGLGELAKLKDLVNNSQKVLLGEGNITAEPAAQERVSREQGKFESKPSSIEKFFETVGQGVINAQQQLDSLSTEYIINQPVQTQPALFRIPKVNAEIHFAIEKMDEKGFNVLVYGASEARREEQQHKVSFEIVAAPPPPDMSQRLQKINIGGILLVDPLSRKRAKEMLTTFCEKNKQAPQNEKKLMAARAGNFIKEFRRVILIKSESTWALILPLKTDKEQYNLDVIYLVNPENGMDVVDDFKSEAAEPRLTRLVRFNKLAAILDQLSARQESVLQDLGLSDAEK